MLGKESGKAEVSFDFLPKHRCLTGIGAYFILRPLLKQGPYCHVIFKRAEVAKLADALDSGSSGGNLMGVQLPPSAPSIHCNGIEINFDAILKMARCQFP